MNERLKALPRHLSVYELLHSLDHTVSAAVFSSTRRRASSLLQAADVRPRPTPPKAREPPAYYPAYRAPIAYSFIRQRRAAEIRGVATVRESEIAVDVSDDDASDCSCQRVRSAATTFSQLDVAAARLAEISAGKRRRRNRRQRSSRGGRRGRRADEWRRRGRAIGRGDDSAAYRLISRWRHRRFERQPDERRFGRRQQAKHDNVEGDRRPTRRRYCWPKGVFGYNRHGELSFLAAAPSTSRLQNSLARLFVSTDVVDSMSEDSAFTVGMNGEFRVLIFGEKRRVNFCLTTKSASIQIANVAFLAVFKLESVFVSKRAIFAGGCLPLG